MSDEASGPENEDNLQEWTTQMAIASHKDVTNMTAVQLYQDKYYEVIKPEWRSQEVSCAFKDY